VCPIKERGSGSSRIPLPLVSIFSPPHTLLCWPQPEKVFSMKVVSLKRDL